MAGIESALLKSPLSVKPGALVELSTWSLVSNYPTDNILDRKTYHFVDFLGYPVAHLGHILLQRIHKCLDVALHLIGREPQLSDCHAHHAQPFPVLASSDHIPYACADLRDDGARLGAGHHALGSQNATHVGLVHLLQRVYVANAAVKLDRALLDQVEDVVLAHENGARGACLCGCLGVWRGDYANANVCLDGMRQA